jgi:hypothetical protein
MRTVDIRPAMFMLAVADQAPLEVSICEFCVRSAALAVILEI